MLNRSAKQGVVILLLAFCFTLAVSAYNISDKDVSIDFDTAIYTGRAICPEVNVRHLTEGKNYFVTYTNNVNAGRAVIMVDDVNDSCPTVYRYFDILPCNISNAEIKLRYTEATFSGKSKKPSVTVTFNGKALKEGRDYTVSYKNNKKPGKAQVIVKGKGNFCGEAVKYFYIRPEKVKSLKAKKKTSDTVTLTWSRVTGATEYRVYRYVNGKWKLAGSTEKTQFTVKKLSSDKEYKFRVRAVCKLKSKKLYGRYSKVLRVRTRLSGNDKIYISPKGSKYHRKNCSYIKNNKNKVTYSYAKSKGYTACSRCFD